VWPHVKELVINQLKDISQSHRDPNDPVIVVVEAAVLLDANWDENNLFDGIWVIRSSEETSIDRLVNKRGMTKEDAIKRIESQFVRRGIGNFKDELNAGNVTSIILNEGPDLWNKLKKCLLDPSSWKKDRHPKLQKSDLEE
jgi:dephospho-CoA kinase